MHDLDQKASTLRNEVNTYKVRISDLKNLLANKDTSLEVMDQKYNQQKREMLKLRKD